MFEAMLQGEMDAHLGYRSNERGEKPMADRHNGYGKKTLKTTAGSVEVRVPRDRGELYPPVGGEAAAGRERH